MEMAICVSSVTCGSGEKKPKIRKPIRPMTPRRTPTAVARECVRIGSCSITASLRTRADCILRSTKR
ncbi:hypothetical protein GCM10018963_31070 [Saccharothrix longispora]